MHIQDAIHLIQNAIPIHQSPQKWIDLGCGSGTFTLALASLLPAGSTIYAVDKIDQIINTNHLEVNIVYVKADFEHFDFDFKEVDGIMMANSLHFVSDKKSLITRFEKYFVSNKFFVVVEYETDTSNQWVPFPICYDQIKSLFVEIDYKKVSKIASRKSIYGKGDLYVATASDITNNENI